MCIIESAEGDSNPCKQVTRTLLYFLVGTIASWMVFFGDLDHAMSRSPFTRPHSASRATVEPGVYNLLQSRRFKVSLPLNIFDFGCVAYVSPVYAHLRGKKERKNKDVLFRYWIQVQFYVLLWYFVLTVNYGPLCLEGCPSTSKSRLAVWLASSKVLLQRNWTIQSLILLGIHYPSDLR